MLHADHCRKGISKLLMNSFEEWALASKCKLIALATHRAAAFYQAIGYEKSATY
jgi:GNAT superfamily N-acetyltransferase